MSGQRIRRGAAVLSVVAALLLTGCTEQGLGPGTDDGAVQEYTGADRVKLDFTGTTVDGSTFRSSAERGRVLVVNFWYAGCAPCLQETHDLVAVEKEYAGKGVRFVGVNVRDTADDARAFLTARKVPYPSILDVDRGRVQLAFARSRLVAPNAVPTTVVLDAHGRATARITGVLQGRDILTSLLDTALKDS